MSESAERYQEAIAALRKAIELQHDYADAYKLLGFVLNKQQQLPEAEVALRKAIELKHDFPDSSATYGTLGEALLGQRKLLEAEAAFRKAIELNPGDPEAYWDLTITLGRQQKYLEAATAYRKALAFEGKLVDDPRRDENRYNAACAAALVGCGQGKDTRKLDDKERARLRGQALGWLRADLIAWRRILEKEPDQTRPMVRQRLKQWQQNTDFNSVRGTDALAKLPEAERQEWQKLWLEVEELGRRAAEPK
jgi:tetratricopeptide (TPR) repeat protein